MRVAGWHWDLGLASQGLRGPLSAASTIHGSLKLDMRDIRVRGDDLHPAGGSQRGPQGHPRPYESLMGQPVGAGSPVENSLEIVA